MTAIKTKNRCREKLFAKRTRNENRLPHTLDLRSNAGEIVFRRTCNFFPLHAARRKKNPKNPSSEGRELTTLDEGTKKTLSATFPFLPPPPPVPAPPRPVEKGGLTQFMHPKQTETRLYYKYRGTGQKISARWDRDPPSPLALRRNRISRGVHNTSSPPTSVPQIQIPEVNQKKKRRRRAIAVSR